MILNVTVDVVLDEVTDPANIITRITEALTTSLRTVEGATSFQIVRVLPEDEPPPVVAKTPTEEETQEDV